MATPEQVAQFKLDNWQHALAVSKQTGVDPRIVMAQAGVESDWGNAAPGNNVFGIKGPGQTLQTQEAGPDGKLYNTTDSFSAYPSTAHSFSHYASLPIVQKVGQAGDYDSQIGALKKSGYATAPNYASVIDKTAQDLKVPEGVAPSVLPIVQTTQVNGPGPGGSGGASVVPPDPRNIYTAPDAPADVTGQNPDNPMPTKTLIPGRTMQALNAQATGLLAAGAPTQIAPQRAVPMLQVNRPRAQLNAAPIIPGLRGLLG